MSKIRPLHCSTKRVAMQGFCRQQHATRPEEHALVSGSTTLLQETSGSRRQPCPTLALLPIPISELLDWPKISAVRSAFLTDITGRNGIKNRRMCQLPASADDPGFWTTCLPRKLHGPNKFLTKFLLNFSFFLFLYKNYLFSTAIA